MALVRSRDTGPELKVRRFLHARGLRYRLGRRVAGTRPDMVFPARRIALFVHGCIWHQHPDETCKLARMPKSRLEFWRPKLEGNSVRDRRQYEALAAEGWKIIVVWECELTNDIRMIEVFEEIMKHVSTHGQ